MMDQNFLQMLGQLQPEDGSANPYAVSQVAAPAVDPNIAAPANLLQGIPGYGVQQAAAADPTAPVAPQAANVLQSLAPGDPNVAPPSVASAPATQPARARSSLLDTVGRLADVFAKVGGANALYQPTMDAYQDRTLALGDHDQQSALNQLKIASNAMDNSAQQGKQIQSAAAGLQALMKANSQNYAPGTPGAANAWGVLAQRAGLDPQKAAQIFSQIQSDPNTLATLASGTDDGKEKYSGSLTYVKNPITGEVRVLQAGLTGNDARNILPEGFSPIAPPSGVKVVDGGNASYLIDGDGKLVGTMTKGQSPDNAATNTKDIKIAGMPERPKPVEATKGDPSAGLTIIKNIQDSFDRLHQMEALPGEGGTIGNAIGTLGRTPIGQSIGAISGLSPAAQEREILAKNLSSLQSDMLKSLPGSATRTRFEQEIQKKRLPDPTMMNYSTANRAIQQYRDAYNAALKEPEPPVPAATRPATIQPSTPAASGAPTVSNW